MQLGSEKTVFLLHLNVLRSDSYLLLSHGKGKFTVLNIGSKVILRTEEMD